MEELKKILEEIPDFMEKEFPDWKTAMYNWSRQKKQNFIVKSQLIYYKNIWSKKHNIDLKDIRCAFIILKRKMKDGKRCELFSVSVGEKTSERAFKNMGNMVFNLMNDRFFKNRTSCEYCEFKDTDYCKNWIQMKLK